MAPPLTGSRHPIAAYYLFVDPEKGERLSWPGWMTHIGRFAHISGHLSATGWAQARESLPAKDLSSTAVPCNQLRHIQGVVGSLSDDFIADLLPSLAIN